MEDRLFENENIEETLVPEEEFVAPVEDLEDNAEVFEEQPEEYATPEEFTEPEEYATPKEFATPEEFTEPEEFAEPEEFVEQPTVFEHNEPITVAEPTVEEQHPEEPTDEYIEQPKEDFTAKPTKERKEKITVDPPKKSETKTKKEKTEKPKNSKKASKSFGDVLRDIKDFFKKVKKALKSPVGKKVLKIVGIVLLVIAFLLPVGLLAYVVSSIIDIISGVF